MNTNLFDFEIVSGKDLRPNDEIIHNYDSFKVQECQEGKGAGNDFGEYIRIVGNFNGTYVDPKMPAQEFWTFQNSPVVRRKTAN